MIDISKNAIITKAVIAIKTLALKDKFVLVLIIFSNFFINFN